MTNVNKKIKDIITKNDVVLFMKGTPEMPQWYPILPQHMPWSCCQIG